jgi:hypothetical protein
VPLFKAVRAIFILVFRQAGPRSPAVTESIRYEIVVLPFVLYARLDSVLTKDPEKDSEMSARNLGIGNRGGLRRAVQDSNFSDATATAPIHRLSHEKRAICSLPLIATKRSPF